MKKNVLKRTFAAMAVTAVAATSMASKLVSAESTPTPYLGISRITIKESELADNMVQTIKVSVNGAEALWSLAGLHVEFDRDVLELVRTISGGIPSDYNMGPATDNMTLATVEPYDNGLFFAASAAPMVVDGVTYYRGGNGVIFEFKVQLPEDAAAGDKYEFNFVFSESAASDPSAPPTQDMFTNKEFYDSANKVDIVQDGVTYSVDPMTAAAVNNWQHGYIEIVDDKTTPTEPTDPTGPTDPTVAPTTAGPTGGRATTTTTTGTKAPDTGVGLTGLAVAAAGLMTATGAAFVLRKKD